MKGPQENIFERILDQIDNYRNKTNQYPNAIFIQKDYLDLIRAVNGETVFDKGLNMIEKLYDLRVHEMLDTKYQFLIAHVVYD
jgi:hypothetical protein